MRALFSPLDNSRGSIGYVMLPGELISVPRPLTTVADRTRPGSVSAKAYSSLRSPVSVISSAPVVTIPTSLCGRDAPALDDSPAPNRIIVDCVAWHPTATTYKECRRWIQRLWRPVTVRPPPLRPVATLCCASCARTTTATRASCCAFTRSARNVCAPRARTARSTVHNAGKQVVARYLRYAFAGFSAG